MKFGNKSGEEGHVLRDRAPIQRRGYKKRSGRAAIPNRNGRPSLPFFVRSMRSANFAICPSNRI